MDKLVTKWLDRIWDFRGNRGYLLDEGRKDEFLALFEKIPEEIRGNSSILCSYAKMSEKIFSEVLTEDFIQRNAKSIFEALRKITSEKDFTSPDLINIFYKSKEYINKESIGNTGSRQEYNIEPIDEKENVFQGVDSNTFLRANGTTKLFEFFENYGNGQLLFNIKKGEIIPKGGNNVTICFDTTDGSQRKIIPSIIYDDIFSSCKSDEEYRLAFKNLGYDIPEDAKYFMEGESEERGDFFIVFSEGLSRDTNYKLIMDFFNNPDIEYFNRVEFIEYHINSLRKCLGDEFDFSQFIDKEYMEREGISEEEKEAIIRRIRALEESQYTPSEIAEGIEPIQSEINGIMAETAREASTPGLDPNAKSQEDNDSNPGGDKR